MAFELKTAEQLAELEPDAVLKYAVEATNATAEQQKEAAAQLDTLQTKLDELGEEHSETKEAIKTELLGLKAKQEQAKKSGDKPQGFMQQVKSQLSENLEGLAAMKGNRSAPNVKLQIKAAGDMLTTSNITDGDMIYGPEMEAGIVQDTRLRPSITNHLLNSGSTSSRTIYYVEKENPDGAFDFIGEGVVKPQVDFDLVERSSSAKKVAGHIKTSTEMLQDIDFMAAEIRNELLLDHNIHLEEGIVNGDGTGANLQGITDFASSFSAGALATSVDLASNMDAIRSVINQIVVTSNGAYYPTHVFVHPTIIALYEMEKVLSSATDGRYKMAPFVAADGRSISGVTIVATTKMPTTHVLVGDMNRVRYRVYQDFEISIGYENDDFTKNLVTILGESRVHLYCPDNEQTAFVYDALATIKTAIETP